MSPRPRKVTDADIYMAAQRAMTRLAPGELTLAAIAEEAGVTAGLLVQRFGSKRDLLLSLSEQFSGGNSEMFAELRKGHRSALATLRAYSDCLAHMASRTRWQNVPIGTARSRRRPNRWPRVASITVTRSTTEARSVCRYRAPPNGASTTSGRSAPAMTSR